MREEHRYEKMAINKYLSIITLNVNGLNAPIKRHRTAEWIRNHNLHLCWLQERAPPQYKRPTQTESEGLETNIPSNGTGTKQNKTNKKMR